MLKSWVNSRNRPLIGGKAHDLTHTQSLIEDIAAGAVVIDKAFDAGALIADIDNRGSKAVIPPESNRVKLRAFDRHQHKHRNLIERFFCRIKQFRGIATRFNKLASRFSEFIAIAASFIWLI